MGMVSQYFDQALDMNFDEEMIMELTNEKQVHSFRTMLYREKKAFEEKSGLECDLSFFSEGNKLIIRRGQEPKIEIRKIASEHSEKNDRLVGTTDVPSISGGQEHE